MPLRQPHNIALFVLVMGLAVAGFLLVPADAVLPIRWGFDLSVTDSAPRTTALLQMPVATVLVWGVCFAFLRFGSEERREKHTRTIAILLPAVTALFALIAGATLVAGLSQGAPGALA
jgi:hypothetical protein